jgi:hypothetical protein
VNSARIVMLFLTVCLLGPAARGWAASMTFDQTQWHTGDMNEQSQNDSAGGIANSNVDYYYYYERIPMRMAVIDDSLAGGSPARTYDSAVLAMVVASQGLAGSDSMHIFGKRLARDWSEYGVSWKYHHASADSAWAVAGGDVNALACMDTIIIDAAVAVYDTIRFYLDTGFVRFLVETANHGWLLMAENIVDRGAFQLFTEDASNAAYRPVLTVYYTDGAAAAHEGRRRRVNALSWGGN